mgnify:CR=1 FL=1
MAKIEVSVNNPETSFVYNGLEYKKGVWELYYTNKSTPEQNESLDNVQVGIRSVYTNRILQQPLHISSWKDASNNSYIDIQSLVSDIMPIISTTSFNGARAANK